MGLLFSNSDGVGSGPEQWIKTRLSLEGAFYFIACGLAEKSLSSDSLIGASDGRGQAFIAEGE